MSNQKKLDHTMRVKHFVSKDPKARLSPRPLPPLPSPPSSTRLAPRPYCSLALAQAHAIVLVQTLALTLAKRRWWPLPSFHLLRRMKRARRPASLGASRHKHLGL